MSLPILSVITVCYNSGATISDTLASVAAQSYQAIEHLIVDGGSTDDTLSVVRRFPHVGPVISEPDKGLYDAMNKGIDRAAGEVIGLLNSDDFYTDPNVLAAVMARFENPAVMAVYGDLQYVDAIDTNRTVRNWVAGEIPTSRLSRGWMPPHPAFFVRSSVYERYGRFDLSYRIGADVEFMLRVLARHRVPTVYLPRVLVKMRIGGLSNRSWANRLQLLREFHRAYIANEPDYRFYTIPLRILTKIPQFFK